MKEIQLRRHLTFFIVTASLLLSSMSFASLFSALSTGDLASDGQVCAEIGSSLAARGVPGIRPDVVLSGGRSGQLVKDLVGPPSSVVRGGGARAFVTNEQGQVILDITAGRVKPVIPGQGFGPKRPPTTEELDLLSKILGGGQ